MTILDEFTRDNEELRNQALEQVKKAYEMSVIEEIIAISRGLWEDYSQYVHYKHKQQTEAIEHNSKYSRYYYMPVTYILTEEQFNYARSFYDKN